MGIGVSLFLFVVGAILTFAVDVNSSSGFSIDTVGIILMVGGLLGLLVSALVRSSFSPWSRYRTMAGRDRVVEGVASSASSSGRETPQEPSHQASGAAQADARSR